MRPIIRIAALATIATALPAQTEGLEELYWHPSYEAAREEARRTGKPIFLEFRCAP